MTREEAIKAISDMILDMEYPNGVYHEKFTEDESQKHLALYAVKKALRPVSREQVEKVWRGEWKSTGAISCKCSKCNRLELKSRANEYNFCPYCMSPMTDEAVQMVVERMEALKDGSETD